VDYSAQLQEAVSPETHVEDTKTIMYLMIQQLTSSVTLW